MALTVGELNGIITIDDRAVNPALRRAENALRAAGNQMGGDADRAGQQAGQQLGQGLVRGADGQWRNMRGELVDAVTAAAAEAESEARRAGQHIGEGVTHGLNGLRGDAARIGQQAGDDLGEGLADGAGDGADDAVDQAEGGLSKLKAAALGVGVAAGAILMDAFGQAMEQGQITAKLGASMGKTPAEAQRYGKIAGQLYADAVTEDFQTAADTIGSVMAAGLTPPNATNAQIKSISANLHDLSDTFELDLGQAANAAGQMIKTGLAKDGKEALDVMTRGMQVMGPRADDLADTFNEYSTIFRQMGISATDATGLMSQGMAAGARDTDVVADSLKEFVLITQKGGKDVDTAFKQIGLSGKEMQAAFSKGGPGAKKALDQVFDGMRKIKDPTQRAQLAVALFGTKAEDTQKALFALDPSKAADGLGKVAGAADEAGHSIRDNAATQLDAFRRGAMQQLVDFLGGTAVPALMKFVGFLRDHQTELKVFAAVITAVVLPALLALGVQALIAGGRMAAAWLVALGPIGWIGLAIGALVVLVITYWDQIKGATLTAWRWLVDKISWAITSVLSAVGRIAAIPGRVARWWIDLHLKTIAIALKWVAWVATLPGRVSGALAAMAGYLAARGAAAFTALRNAAATRAVAMIAWVRGLPGKISGAIGAVSGLLVSKGHAIVQGLWSGIQSMGGWLRSQLISWAKSVIPGPIAKALGINSPSKVTTAQGRWIARGLVAGLTGSSKQVKSAATKLADIVRDSLSPGRKRSNALGKIAAGTKQLVTLARREETLATRMKAATKKLADQRKAREKLAADVKKGVLDSANITQQTGSEGNSAESILDGLRANRAAAQQFAADLAKLRKKGVRADLIAQIAQAGVQQGSSAAAALANANSGQIKAINKEQHALVVAAGTAGDTAGNAMYQSGIAAGQGLVKGLRSQQKAIEAQMAKIAKSMSSAIRKALGIRSPSRVMARVGAYTAEGVREGIESGRAAVNRSMSSLVETPSPAEWALDASTAQGTRGSASRPSRLVKVGSDGSKFGDLMVSELRKKVQVLGGDVQFVLGKG